MKPEEIAAYIGAAAWLPQIAMWLYRSIVRPKLRIVPDQFAEVGFTSLGPIFNVRMAFFVENRDIIIDDVELVLRHQDGESRTFRWAGLGETFSEITDSTGKKQIVSRDQSPIAIKVSTQALFEKFFRFQEPKFHQADRPTTQNLIAHFNFLKQKNPDSFVAEVLNSKEIFAVIEGRQKWFWWKPGSYELTVSPRSPQNYKLIGSKFSFDLSSVDIDHLKKNFTILETEIQNVVSSNLPEYGALPVNWQWVNVNMLRVPS